eukprot:5730138-Prymnesium_polylepis.1
MSSGLPSWKELPEGPDGPVARGRAAFEQTSSNSDASSRSTAAGDASPRSTAAGDTSPRSAAAGDASP